ncbi:MAG: sugar ABC transporter permease [Chloroflexi bacterium]|nr:sugar ABC transporter permease [Chloroflexota bacterium]
MKGTSQSNVSWSRRMGERWGRLLHREESLGYILSAPALIFLAVLLGYPLVLAIYLSFTNKHLGAPAQWVGLANFINLFSTSLYWVVFRNTFVYTIIALIFKFVGGLLLAQLLNRDFIGKRAARAMLLMPWIVPTVFSTLAWRWMFEPSNSILNILLTQMGLIHADLPWITKGPWAMGVMIFVNVWRGVPFFAITFLAALQSVPEELIDASKIDGANSWNRFWRVVFPLVIPVMTVVVLMSSISSLGEFELPYLLTRGGPGDSTNVLGMLTYNYAITGGVLGLGSAVAVTTLPIVAVLVIQALREVRQRNK